MTALFRDSFVRAFVLGFAVVGIPMVISTGLFA